jgi:sugar lactone lactonase YvrE
MMQRAQLRRMPEKVADHRVQLEQIDVPEPWTANVSFGGRDHQTLFITASKGLYAIKLRVKGANAAK